MSPQLETAMQLLKLAGRYLDKGELTKAAHPGASRKDRHRVGQEAGPGGSTELGWAVVRKASWRTVVRIVGSPYQERLKTSVTQRSAGNAGKRQTPARAGFNWLPKRYWKSGTKQNWTLLRGEIRVYAWSRKALATFERRDFLTPLSCVTRTCRQEGTGPPAPSPKVAVS
jgi:hypothetical protein